MSKINISISIEDVDARTLETLETLLKSLKSEPTVEVEKKPTRKRAPKKELEVVGDSTEKEVVKKEVAKEESSDIKIEDVRALLAVKVADNREAIKAKLTELKAKNVTTLKEEHYEAFSKFLNDL